VRGLCREDRGRGPQSEGRRDHWSISVGRPPRSSATPLRRRTSGTRRSSGRRSSRIRGACPGLGRQCGLAVGASPRPPGTTGRGAHGRSRWIARSTRASTKVLLCRAVPTPRRPRWRGWLRASRQSVAWILCWPGAAGTSAIAPAPRSVKSPADPRDARCPTRAPTPAQGARSDTIRSRRGITRRPDVFDGQGPTTSRTSGWLGGRVPGRDPS
jgi:hypothetical protein